MISNGGQQQDYVFDLGDENNNDIVNRMEHGEVVD